MVYGVEWAQELGRTNIFFNHLGSLKLEKGSFKIIKTIEIELIEDQINAARNEVTDLLTSCNNKTCSIIDDKVEKDIMNELLQLNHEINTVYSLLGNYQTKRSLNFIGSGLKYLFGTMDNDDAENINSVLQSVGNRQDKLHTSMVKTVHIMTNLSRQWVSLKENQDIQFNNFMSLKQLLYTQHENDLKIENGLNIRTIQLHFDNLILSIKVQIDKLKNAILFLKAGVLDPYFIDPGQLTELLSYERLRYHVTPLDTNIIMSNSKPVALNDVKNKS